MHADVLCGGMKAEETLSVLLDVEKASLLVLWGAGVWAGKKNDGAIGTRTWRACRSSGVDDKKYTQTLLFPIAAPSRRSPGPWP